MAKNARKNIRIGIIGAGPAGLGAAEALKEQGYDNVIIFEKRKRVGGQALSLQYKTPDGRLLPYEVGSLQPLGSRFSDFHQLIKRYQIQFNDPVYAKTYSFKQKKIVTDFSRSIIGYPLTFKNIFYYTCDLGKLFYYLFRYRKLAKPVYTSLPDQYLKELCISYSQWLSERKFKLITKEINLIAGSMLTFANPAHKDEVPAIKLIKLLLEFIKPPIRYLNGKIKTVHGGYEEIWNRVAKNHRVLLNSKIIKITRSANNVEVITAEDSFHFDKIIITCAPYEILKFLNDINAEEKQIFNKVHYNPGWRGAFIAKHLPTDGAYTFYEPFTSLEYPIRLITFLPHGKIDDETALFSAIFSYSKTEDFPEVLKNTTSALKEYFNADVIKWINQSYWPEYTPYFSCSDVYQGIYNKFESIQGKNHTLYLGATISGGTHGIVVNYAYNRIRHFFPK